MLKLLALSLLVAASGDGSVDAATGAGTGSGSTSPLSNDGYLMVAARKDDAEMKTYIERVIRSLDREVVDEGGLNGFVRFYSGVEAVQTHERLEEELKTVAWVKPASTSSIAEEANPEPMTQKPLLRGKASSIGAGSESTDGTQVGVSRRSMRKSVDHNTMLFRKPDASAMAAASKAKSGRAPVKAPSMPTASEPATIIAERALASVATSAVNTSQRKRGSHAVNIVALHDEKNKFGTTILRVPVPDLQKIDSTIPKAKAAAANKPLRAARSKVSADASPAASKPVAVPRVAARRQRAVPAKGGLSLMEKVDKILVRQLPNVSDIRTKAVATLSTFKSQVDEMEHVMQLRQAASKTKLATTKAEYQKNLEIRKRNNLNITKGNEALRAQVATAIKENELLKHKADSFTEANDVLREAVGSLKTRSELATEFIADSVNLTDDAKEDALKVLTTSTPKPDLDFYLAKARSELGLTPSTKKAAVVDAEEEDTPLSLLQLDDVTLHDDEHPSQYIALMTNSLASLNDAEQRGEARMRDAYTKIADSLDHHHEELAAEQASLQDQLEHQVTRHAELNLACDHLAKNFESFEQRLNGFRVFAKKVDEAMADSVKMAAL